MNAAVHAAVLVLLSKDDETRGVAVRMLHRLEDAEAKRCMEQQHDGWHKWVASSLERGAGKAHKWTNQLNSKVADLGAQGKLPQDVAEEVRNQWAEEWMSCDEQKTAEADEEVRALRNWISQQESTVPYEKIINS